MQLAVLTFNWFAVDGLLVQLAVEDVGAFMSTFLWEDSNTLPADVQRPAAVIMALTMQLLKEKSSSGEPTPLLAAEHMVCQSGARQLQGEP